MIMLPTKARTASVRPAPAPHPQGTVWSAEFKSSRIVVRSNYPVGDLSWSGDAWMASLLLRCNASDDPRYAADDLDHGAGTPRYFNGVLEEPISCRLHKGGCEGVCTGKVLPVHTPSCPNGLECQFSGRSRYSSELLAFLVRPNRYGGLGTLMVCACRHACHAAGQARDSSNTDGSGTQIDDSRDCISEDLAILICRPCKGSVCRRSKYCLLP